MSPSIEQQFARRIRALDSRGRIVTFRWFFDGFVVFWARVTERWAPERREDHLVERVYGGTIR